MDCKRWQSYVQLPHVLENGEGLLLFFLPMAEGIIPADASLPSSPSFFPPLLFFPFFFLSKTALPPPFSSFLSIFVCTAHCIHSLLPGFLSLRCNRLPPSCCCFAFFSSTFPFFSNCGQLFCVTAGLQILSFYSPPLLSNLGNGSLMERNRRPWNATARLPSSLLFLLLFTFLLCSCFLFYSFLFWCCPAT